MNLRIVATVNLGTVTEMFSYFCRGCRSFKPKYIALAEKMTKKRPELEFYAVSCVAKKEICAKYKIKGYPSIMTFPANSKEGTELKRSKTPMSSAYAPADILRALRLSTRSKGKNEGDKESDEEDDSEGSQEREQEVGEADERHDEKEEHVEKDGVTARDEVENTVDEKETSESSKEETSEISALSLKNAASLSGMGGNSASRVKELKTKYAKQRLSDSASSVLANTGPVASATNSTIHASEADSSQEEVDEDEREIEEEEEDDESEGRKSEVDRDKKNNDEGNDEPSEETVGRTPLEGLAESHGDKAGIKGTARVPGAGATLAGKTQSDMDQWSGAFMKLIEGQKKGRKGGSDVLSAPGATKTMLANTPGTKEFAKKKRTTLDRVHAVKGKRSFLKKKAAITPDMENDLLKKKNLPFKIEPKKQTLVQKLPVIKSLFKMSSEEELVLDASLSFVTGLKHGVFMSRESLSDKKKEALKGWLELSSVGLPPEWGLHALIDELTENIDFISQSDENLNKILNKHPLPRQKWSKSCDAKGKGGFSCGMWKLFHTITIGIAEHRGGLNLIEAKVVDPNTRVFSPADAADAIREYGTLFVVPTTSHCSHLKATLSRVQSI